MCGVIGLICEHEREDLGRVAAELLQTLEYRGYDSTGAALQAAGDEVILRKDVGAPSAILAPLGIPELGGQIFCGQVRWATFGAVDRSNAQPHVVRCKRYLYGAHNGNVTNCDQLKAWLTEEGHQVLSDNDGEMVVHTIEHFFAAGLAEVGAEQHRDATLRQRLMRAAIRAAATRLQGSYAAVIVDPVARTLFAIKMGSSLYFGQGKDPEQGAFAIASSDLSSVLKMTHVLLPLAEREFVQYRAEAIEVYSIAVGDDQPLARSPVRSRLRARDAALDPAFEYYMEQEIEAQEQGTRDLIRMLGGGSEALQSLRPLLEALDPTARARLRERCERITHETTIEAIQQRFQEFLAEPAWQALVLRLPAHLLAEVDSSPDRDPELHSDEKWLCADLLQGAASASERAAARVLDGLLEDEEVLQFSRAIGEFSDRCRETLAAGKRVFLVCCGTSFHAAKTASLFFNDIAGAEVLALLPGEFRAQHSNTLRDGDLLVAVSQSGETKDLIDIIDSIAERGQKVQRVAIVNNVNSTLAQEKCDLLIPLRCGSEIAVPATKSFTSQLVIFYYLALRLAARCGLDVRAREAAISRLPELIRRTLIETDAALEEAAALLYLAPSIHILATRLLAVGKEGALKIREVVLNHTEGFEASEFKHGPNTILGFNTVLGPEQVDHLLRRLTTRVAVLLDRGPGLGLDAVQVRDLALQSLAGVFDPRPTPPGGPAAQELLASLPTNAELISDLRRDYPLIYITGPDPRDIGLTVSQMNTHKIRGAATVVIAEEHPDLRRAACKPPADNPAYRSVYVQLPATDDPLMSVFSATVALQRLAFKMSLRKREYLDRLGVIQHGVHPDVPKNVSKSITVD